VSKRAKNGRLHRIHRRVYAVGRPHLTAASRPTSPYPAHPSGLDLVSRVTRSGPGRLLWRAERLIVETDSRRFHGHRSAFENDHLRDQHLTLAGFTVVRFTWRQVTREPGRVAHTVSGLLEKGRHPPLARLARP
jgi:Protein of unknown function (DUF559)